MSDTTATQTPASANSGSGDEKRPFRYTAALAADIETRWQARWDETQPFAAPNPGDATFDPGKPKFFCLDMFPYPSGAGLHVGHPEGYTATDIVSRFKRHQGYNVLHPMGWDAFGLPAEQYAVQTGVHPRITTSEAIETFRRQLKRLGFSYDWARELATVDEDYYRWTQWIWLQAYHAWYDVDGDRARPISELEAEFASGARPAVFNPVAKDEVRFGAEGETHDWSTLSGIQRKQIVDSYRLAYLSTQTVNWCPKLGTVLANEEVIDGKSERGHYPVHRRPLKQWMFRITAFAERLLGALEGMDWPDSTLTMQREWIGRSEGAEIDFPLTNDEAVIRVYTTRPDTVFGATYMVLAPEHPLVEQIITNTANDADVDAVRAYVEEARNRTDVDRMAESREKTGVFTGGYAINPLTEKQIPVWVADYVLMGYGHGAIMAVPAQDQRDWDFAKAFDLPIVRTVQPPDDFEGEAYIGEGPAINSGFLDGLEIAGAKARVIDWLEEQGVGERTVNFKLRDWLFSRQRYWGEPFPVVTDEDGNTWPVDAAALPVKLPDLEDFKPAESEDPQPLLGKAADWVHTTAGEAGVSGDELAKYGGSPDMRVTRETNTMPNWAGSCWYYLRFCDPRNADRFVGEEAERYWMGGAGVDLYIGGAEHAVLHLLYARFWHKVLFDLGCVCTDEPFSRVFHQGMITSYAYRDNTGRTVPVDEVEDRDGRFVLKTTGEEVEHIVAKMSKTFKNVINPDDVIHDFGADTFRLYEMYMGPLEASTPWNPRDIVGVFRFLQRTWRLAVDENTGELTLRDASHEQTERQLHRTIAKVGDDIDRLAFNTAIAAMIEFVNTATSNEGLTRDQLERFAIVLAPFAPHVAEEVWAKLGHGESITRAAWPSFNRALLQDDTIELPVQILGKVRGRITVPADADQQTVEQLAVADHRIQTLLAGRTVRKVIVVPGKIVNIIAQ